MEEKDLLIETDEEKDGLSGDKGDTDAAVADGVIIPVKFNKEIKNLTAGQAATLAQKGMKFEMIEDDFSKLRAMAAKNNKSVPEYLRELEKREINERREALLKACGGNEELTEHVIKLEEGKEPDDGLDELREFFPTVKSLDDLPRAVVESARMRGENLLNSYLKYRVTKRKRLSEEGILEQSAADSSIGSQKSALTGDDEFIKALWGR